MEFLIRSAKGFLAEGLLRSKIVQHLSSLRNPPWKVITYHRILDPEAYPYPIQTGMYVRPQTFKMQMQVLSDSANILSLNEILSSIIRGETLPPRTIAITFDDGWRDNFEVAFPVLREFGFSANIFLATSFIGGNRTFWSDRILEVLSIVSANQSLRTRIVESWSQLKNLGKDAIFSLNQFLFTPNNNTAESLLGALKKLDEEAQLELFAVIEKITGLPFEHRDAPSFLSWQEVRCMSEGGITFSSHSHSHRPMTWLNKQQISDEVRQSQELLRRHNLPIDSLFCYPGGYQNAKTQQALAESGITAALGTERGSDLTSSPYLIGRIGIHEDVSFTPARFLARIWCPGY